MWRLLFLSTFLVCLGCHSLPKSEQFACASRSPNAAQETCATPETSNACAKGACPEIHVKVPPPKVVVMPAEGSCAPAQQCKPQAAAQGIRGQPTANLAQATGVSQEVLLIPRTVYLPYVQQTPVGIARVTSGTQGLAVSQTTVSSAQALAQAEAAGATAGPQASSAAAQGQTAEIQSLRRELQQCQEQLQQLRKCQDLLNRMQDGRECPQR
jgi:hypothetical protein